MLGITLILVGIIFECGALVATYRFVRDQLPHVSPHTNLADAIEVIAQTIRRQISYCLAAIICFEFGMCFIVIGATYTFQ